MKYLRFFFVAAVLLLVATIANAQIESGSCGTNLRWSYNHSNKALTITGTGMMSSYTNRILPPWCSYRNDITSLSLPEGMTSITLYAFYFCSNLTGALIIPNSVQTIGTVGSTASNVFANCSGLTSLTIGNSVTRIGNEAFFNCSGLTSALIIPNSVTAIGARAFSQCTGLTSVTISESVTTINESAFSRCLGLTSVINHRLIPQVVNNRVFSANYSGFNATVYNQATLYVPAASLALYQAVEGWKEFFNIQAIGTSNVNDFSADKPAITGYYSTVGVKLPQEPESGLYIILYDNGKAEKIVR